MFISMIKNELYIIYYNYKMSLIPPETDMDGLEHSLNLMHKNVEDMCLFNVQKRAKYLCILCNIRNNVEKCLCNGGNLWAVKLLVHELETAKDYHEFRVNCKKLNNYINNILLYA